MRIICEIHGCQAVVQLSPDCLDPEGRLAPGIKLICIQFEFDGEIVERAYLSESAAKHLGFQSACTLPLGDDYEPWLQSVAAVCAKCAQVTFPEIVP